MRLPIPANPMNVSFYLLSLLTVHLPPLKMVTVTTTATRELDIVRLASAIEAVENTPTHHVGKDGERSRFQITREVWERNSSMPFEHASSERLVCRAEATRVALAHIDWLRLRLDLHGLPDTPYYIGLAWTAGMTATVSRHASHRKRDYALRVANVYGDAGPVTSN